MTSWRFRSVGLLIVFLSVLILGLGLFHPWFEERVEDDAFYYYQIARNIALTGHSTFDGINPATGYHPLWMGVSVALYYVAGSDLPRALMLFALTLFLIYSICVLRLLDKLSITGWNGVLFKLLLIGNPVFLTHGWTSGLETSPTLLFVFLFMAQCLLRSCGLTGNATTAAVFCALAFVSRLDSILYTYPCYLWAFAPDLRRRPFPALIPVLAVSGFMGVHYMLHGTFVPASADAIRFARYSKYVHDAVLHTGYYVDSPSHVIQFVRNSVEIAGSATGVGSRLFSSTLIAKLCLGVVAIVGAAEAVRHSRHNKKPAREKSHLGLFTLGALIVPLAVLFGSYVTTARAMYFRPWYYPPLALMLGCGVLAVWKSRQLAASRLLVCAVALGMAVTAASDVYQKWQPFLPWTAGNAARQALAMLPPKTMLGSFSSGIYGWEVPNRVINLDGLANDRAYYGAKYHNLEKFLIEAKIQYILDLEQPISETFERRCTPGTKFHLDVIKQWPDGNPKFVHFLYKITFD